jgi:flagellar motor protein MotB
MSHDAKPPVEEEGGESAPLWMISFADMMSLLMAFFVMLSTFSSYGPSEAAKVRTAVKVALQPYYGGWHKGVPRETMGAQATAAGQFERGSEKPTLEQHQGKGLMAETQAGNFRARKVFVIESSKVFLGAGTAFSADGRDFLDTLASYMSQTPGRIVISESGPGREADLGLSRAVSVLQALAAKGVSKDRCSVGAKGMLPDQDTNPERMLEVAILAEGSYR